MKTKKIDTEKTLRYAVAFYFCNKEKVDFILEGKMYQHINTVYDKREDGKGCNTLEIVYDYKCQTYKVFNVDLEKGYKEITIL